MLYNTCIISYKSRFVKSCGKFFLRGKERISIFLTYGVSFVLFEFESLLISGRFGALPRRLLPTFSFLLPTFSFLLPTFSFLLSPSYFLLPTSSFLLPTFYFLLSPFYFLLPPFYFQLPPACCAIYRFLRFQHHSAHIPLVFSRKIW